MPAGAEVVYSTAVPPENPERRAAERELHRADLLAEIARLRRCLAVTGTHGKTTTSAMVVHALRGAGMDPAYVVGGELRSTGANAGWGTGEWIVVEADESDRSLLKLDPEIAVLTNAELDHHSTYGSRLELEQTFPTFMARAGAARSSGTVRRCGRCARPRPSPTTPPIRVWTQPARGLRGADIEVTVSVPGAHNAINAAGALTACALAGASVEAAAARWPISGALGGGSSGWGRRPPARSSTTTTPTIRPRWRRRSPPPARWARSVSWRSSSRTCTRAPGSWRARSAGRWRRPTRSRFCRCTPPASDPRTFPGSTGG